VTSTPSSFNRAVSHNEFVSLRAGVSSSLPAAMISAFMILRFPLQTRFSPSIPAATRNAELVVTTIISRPA